MADAGHARRRIVSGTADSAQDWLNKRSAELRKRIEGVKASDALDDAQDSITARSVPQKAAQDDRGPLEREDAAVLDALRRINRRERAR